MSKKRLIIGLLLMTPLVLIFLAGLGFICWVFSRALGWWSIVVFGVLASFVAGGRVLSKG